LAGLAALDEAVAVGVLEIENGRIADRRPKAQTSDVDGFDSVNTICY
jgi:hypothetical protein